MNSVDLTNSKGQENIYVKVFSHLSGEQLLREKDKISRALSQRGLVVRDGGGGNNRAELMKKIEALNFLIPTANYRKMKLPKGGLKVLPGLKLVHCGKVRNTFMHEDNNNRLIIVATDRISTHDVVHINEIPGKGVSITTVSNYWYSTFSQDEATRHIPTQRALTDEGMEVSLPEILRGKNLEGRTNVARKLRALPIEAIVRGYLYGSALKDSKTGKVYNPETGELPSGQFVEKGLKKCSKFQEPQFTPSTKSDDGDVNVDIDGMISTLKNWLIINCDPIEDEEAGKKAIEYAETIREYSLALYKTANKHAEEKGVSLADTKFEFALDEDGKITLIDEVCTPDSSRYWTSNSIREGEEPEQFDKQAVRDWVMGEWKREGKTLEKPAKKIPPGIIAIAQEKYQEIGTKFSLSSDATVGEIKDKVDEALS